MRHARAPDANVDLPIGGVAPAAEIADAPAPRTTQAAA